MILEYLLLNEKEKKEIADYKPDSVKVELFSLKNTQCLYVEYSNEGNGEKAARLLSEVGEYVLSHFQVKTMRNDSSAYFNNKLYPIASEFERKLRKILYVFSAIKSDEQSVKQTKELEQKDFGQIFTMLFVDDAFMETTKKVVNNIKREYFTKSEVINLLTSIEEKKVWDSLLGENIVPTLRRQFQDIRTFRNDIMHSHNIGWSDYVKAKKLFKRVILEMDSALDDVAITESIANRKTSFNVTLGNALKTQEQFGQMIDSVIPNIMNVDGISLSMSDIYENNSTLQGLSRRGNQLANAMQMSPEMVRTMEQAQKISDLFRKNPELIKAQRQREQLLKVIQNSPGIIVMQEQARRMSQLLQGMSLINNEVTGDMEESENGGTIDGQNEDGIVGHNSAEH